MKFRSLWKAAAAGLLFAFSTFAQAQLYGGNSQSNNATALPASAGLFQLDPRTGAIQIGTVVTVPARTITGITALTRDPTTGTIYAVAKAAAVANRLLITLNLATGAGAEIGNLGDDFSSLAFRPDGQLFGMTGQGAGVPKRLWTINKATAATVQVQDLSALGADGSIIAYNPNGRFYFWSGNGAEIFASVQASAPFTITPIPITGPSNNEVFGAVWDPTQSVFLVHSINAQMDSWTTGGVRSNLQPATLTSVRGMVLFPPGSIPTLSQWALVLLILLVFGAAFTNRRAFAPY
ncbi:MAG TPA: IPTL-CTERM sorting domain-containing protein [Usitatibacter sp.]|nr:IPTL-CTERM sorting domain-containing protein [Usitatibacter sp.]